MNKGRTIREQVHQFVVDNFLFGGSEVRDDVSLTMEGVIDSTGVLELLMFMEDTYGLSVDDAEVVPENFDSIVGLTTYIQRKLAEEPEEAAS